MKPAPLTLREGTGPDLGSLCGICQTAFQSGERLGPCPGCGAPFHGECWDENGGCAVYGCALTPAATAGPVAPSSVWGQEERDCPSCGARIKMAARRCLHCGQPLSVSAEPESPAPPRSVPGLGRAILLFGAGLFPPTAPLALLVGGAWLAIRRRDLRRWPASVRILVIAGLVAAAAVTLVALVGLAVHFRRRLPIED